MMKRLAVVLGIMALTACAEAPKVAPTLIPAPNGTVWPQPPQTARYAYAGTLTGENDFRPKGDEIKKTAAQKVIEVITGFIFGDPEPVELLRPVSGLTRGGRVYVADAGQQAVMVFDLAAKELRRWPHAADDADFASPVAIVSDGAEGIFVSDSVLGAIVHLDRDGKPLGLIGREFLERPTGLARDRATGRLFVADTGRHQVLVVAADGELLDVIGRRGDRPGEFNFPTHVALAGDRLYVADTLNFRVQTFTLAGDGKLSFGRLGLHVGDMTRPKGVGLGADGRIYVVENYFDHLLVFNPEGQFLLGIGGTGLGEGNFYLPSGVWTDEESRVYVADMFNGRVAVFKELTGVDE